MLIQKDKPEIALQKRLEEDGYKVFKNGWPDFLAIKNGRIKLIEVKVGDDKLRNAQIKMMRILSDKGFSCFIWHTKEGLIKFKDYLIQFFPRKKRTLKTKLPPLTNEEIKERHKIFMIAMIRAGFDSQSALALKAGMAPQTLSALLKGKRNTKNHKIKIAKLLNIKFDYLWG